jgi:subtilisin family serine protease
MSRPPRRGAALAVHALEPRDVPTVVGFDQLAVDPSAYHPDRVLVQWADGRPHKTFGEGAKPLGNGLYRVNLPDHVSVADAVELLDARPGVALVQPDFRVEVARTPNDPSFGSLWGLDNTGQSGGTAGADIRAPEAWNTGTGTRRTVVAVIDTGVDYNHPDLRANMWKNTREVAGNGIDDDGNGFRDDVYGYDFANNDSNPMDDNGHGTHVAGTIGAVGNNGIGVAGVNWNTRIMALKFLDGSGSGYLSNAVRALNYAVRNGAHVVNASFGGGGYDSAMATALSNARSRGVIVVAAAGNDGTNNDENAVYPANYPGDNIVSVAATDRYDRLASYSNYGQATVDIAAPGSSIYSTLPNNRYGTFTGTSMATPHVAGALALVWDAHPNWTYRQVIDAVLNSADSAPGLSGYVAHGRLNVERAITLGSDSTPTPTPNPTPAPTPTPTPATPTPAVARTFTSTNVGQAIGDFGRVVSKLTINQDIPIRDLNVRVNASHSYTADVRMYLVGPDGTVVTLVNRRGGSSDHFANTTFDDEAGTGVWQGAGPWAGSFRPEGLLSAFDGMSAKGTWHLVIEDTAMFDTGRLHGWSMTVNGGAAPAMRSTADAVKQSPTSPAEWVGPAMWGGAFERPYVFC